MPTVFSTSPDSTALKGLVQSIWHYQGNTAYAYERILPSVNSQLLINLHENALRHWTTPGTPGNAIGPAGVQGVLTEPVLIDTAQKRNLCGVAFTSFGLSAFCTANASRFTNSLVDASEIWGAGVAKLRATVINSTTPAERCQHIARFLEQQYTDTSEENTLIEHIVTAMAAGTSVSEIRNQTRLSQRGLQAMFDRRIGVRPKMFARIARFSGMLDTLSIHTRLVEQAFDHGFSDQAHLTREFRAFAGTTPTQHHCIEGENHHVELAANNLFKSSAGN